MNKSKSVVRRRNEREPSHQIADTPATEPTTTGSIPNRIDRPTVTPMYDDIARRAYELFEERGREPGRELEDWFRAERELEDGWAMSSLNFTSPAP